MKNVADLTVSQDRIFPIDIIPFRFLHTESAINKIKQAFNVKEVDSSQADKVNFLRGEIKIAKSIKVIDSLSIEPKRIWFTLVGTSKEANLFYESLKEIVVQFDRNQMFRGSKPLTNIEQTVCSVNLDVDFRNLFVDKFNDYLNKTVTEGFSSKLAKAYIKGIIFYTDISYQIKDPSLISHNITLYPTYFSIQPRVDTPLEEKRFYTMSPSDSDTHLKLLEEFETLFKDNS